MEQNDSLISENQDENKEVTDVDDTLKTGTGSMTFILLLMSITVMIFAFDYKFQPHGLACTCFMAASAVSWAVLSFFVYRDKNESMQTLLLGVATGCCFLGCIL